MLRFWSPQPRGEVTAVEPLPGLSSLEGTHALPSKGAGAACSPPHASRDAELPLRAWLPAASALPKMGRAAAPSSSSQPLAEHTDSKTEKILLQVALGTKEH